MSEATSYNHAQYLTERRRMMQWWGDYLARFAKRTVTSPEKLEHVGTCAKK